MLHGRAEHRLLDTYETERIAFARRLVATTDRAFTVVTSSGAVARLRAAATSCPCCAVAVLASRAVRRLLFRTVSQTAINYRGSGLSEGRAGRICGGDRLPWVRTNDVDNFAPLRSLTWQVHVYGDAAAALHTTCASRGLALHVFPWSAAAGRAGLKKAAFYLVRPDGHVALAGSDQSGAAIAAYLDARRLLLG